MKEFFHNWIEVIDAVIVTVSLAMAIASLILGAGSTANYIRYNFFNPYSTGIDFSHQNLTSVKSRSPHCKRKNISNGHKPIK